MARQPVDQMADPVPDSKQAWCQAWGARLDEYEGKVQQIQLQARQQHHRVAADLQSQLKRMRACVDDVDRSSAEDWTSGTERCEQQWHTFEKAFAEAETSVGGISDQPQADSAAEESNCRGHGGQLIHSRV